MGVISKKGGTILCKSPKDINHPDPVICIADLSLPITQPEVAQPVKAGDRYIAINVSSPDASWFNLPSNLQEGDIIQKDSQNLNWLLDLDISKVGPEHKPLVHVDCKGFYYWWNGFEWVEISPCNFGGYLYNEDISVTSNGQVYFTLQNVSKNPERTILKVNGIVVNYPSEYVINGTTLTWLESGYSLSTTDCLQILYC